MSTQPPVHLHIDPDALSAVTFALQRTFAYQPEPTRTSDSQTARTAEPDAEPVQPLSRRLSGPEVSQR